MRAPYAGGRRVRVLSSLRARLALLVLLLAIPAALLIHHFAVRAGEALLAQHSGSQPGSEHALLGQEILGLALLGALALAAVWIGPSLLVDPGRGTLLSAAERLAASDPRSRTDMDRDRGGEVAGAHDDPSSALESRKPQLRHALSELWEGWKEAERAIELAEADKTRVSVPQASTPETPPP